jgi:outer membrane protein assembly factor BamB
VNRPIAPLLLTCAIGIAAFPVFAQPAVPAAIPSESRLSALDPRWTVTFDPPPAAAAAFDQSYGYMPIENGELVAIALDDGATAWRVTLPTRQPPATGDGVVFVATDATVTALEQRTGDTLWEAPVGARIVAPLDWQGQWLFASLETGELVALQPGDGRVLWRQPLGSTLAIAPSAADDRLFVALADGRLAALEMTTGTVAWTLALAEPVTGLLALDDQLLVGTRANQLHSVSIDRGRMRWTQKVGADVAGAPAADDDHVYFVAFDNVLRALNRRNGNLKWTRKLPSRPASGPLRVDNVVLVPFSTQNIGAYVAATGAESFSIRTGELRGVLFVRESARATSPRFISMSREGALHGYAARFEPPPAPLGDLPGTKAGH